MSDLSRLVRTGLKLNAKSVATPPPTPLGSPVATAVVPTSSKRRHLELINAARSGNGCYQKGSLFVTSKTAIEEKNKEKIAARKRRRKKRALDSLTVSTAFYRAALEISPNQIEPTQ